MVTDIFLFLKVNLGFFTFSDIMRIHQDLRVIPTMNAVYALAEGIHQTLQAKCGVNYTSVCPDFIGDDDTNDQIMEKMDTLSFRDPVGNGFRFVEREADRALVFYQVQNSGDEQRVRTLCCIVFVGF